MSWCLLDENPAASKSALIAAGAKAALEEAMKQYSPNNSPVNNYFEETCRICLKILIDEL